MSGTIFEFQAPNGTLYQISGAPDEQSARRRAREYFRDDFPDEFAEWSRNRPLPGFGSALVQSARGAAGSQVSGAGLQLEERGIPGGQTLREAGTAIQGQPLPGDRLLEAGTVLEDLQRRPFQTLATGAGQALGGVFGSIAAPAAIAAGTAALAPAGVATAATIGAGLLAGALSGTSELYDGLVREGVAPERARELAANIGAAIGAAEGGAAVPLIRQILGTTLRKEAVDRIATIAGRSATQQAARGGVRGAAIEGASEAAGGAARQGVIAAETGQTDLGRRAGEVLFEGVLGAVGGGGVGAVSGARDPGRARAELEARSSPEDRAIRAAALEASIRDEAPPVAPAPEGPAPLVGERPQPFAAPEQAADYLAANPEPTGRLTPAAATAWANARRDAAWESQVEAARPTALAEFTAAPATPEATPQSNQSFFGNIAEAAVTDQIRLTGFKPQDVARYAFESRGIQKVKPSEAEIQAVTQRLDSLVADNLLERTPAGLYRVSTQAPGTQTPAQAQAPAPTPASVPGTGPGPAPMPTPAATQAPPPQPTPAPGPGPAPMPTPAPAPTPPMPSAAEQTATPETQRAQGSLAEIAQTGNPASPPAPTEQISAALWTGYSLASGPETNNPIVIAAREVAKASRRLTLNEFQSFANTWTSLPTDADRLAFAEQASQNLGLLSGRPAPVAAPLPASAPAPMPAPPLPQPPGAPAAPLPNAPTAGPPPQPAPAPAPMQAPTATPNAAPEVTQTGTAQAAPEAGAAQAPAPEQAQEPAPPTGAEQERPVAKDIPSEAVGEDLSPAADTDVRQTDNAIYEKLAGVLPENPAQGRQIIAQATRDTMFNKFTRGFFSPILTMPKWRPEMAAASRVARFFMRRTNQFNVEVQNLLARNSSQFTDDQRSVMGRRLEQSSKEGKPFNRDGLTPEMIAKMEDIQQAGQRAFDYFVEANTIKFYDPLEAQTPAARAAIEQMWRRNPNRNLSQISDADLRAGSLDGFKVKQELEAMRNRYYLPMTSDGKTHFIAAYPKGPDGKRKPGAKPVAVVPLNPLTPKRRKAGVPDPEVLARQELTNRGFDASRYYVTPGPVEFTRDADVASIRDNADFIASFVEKLRSSVGNNVEAQALLRSMQSSLDKARMQGILRPNQGILIPITKLNETTYLTKTVPQYYAGLAKLQSRRYTEHSFQRAIKGLNPADQAYWKEHRDYMTAPTDAAWISNIRTFNFHWFMGAALDTAILNATQVYSSTIPLLVRDGGARGLSVTQNTINQFFASPATGKAAAGRDTEAYIKTLVRNVARSPEEAQALARAARLEVFTPIFTTESGGVSDVNIKEALIARGVKNPDRFQRAADTLVNLSGLPQRTAETLNRSITFLAAFRLAKQNPEVIARANRLDGYNFTGPNAAFEYAVSRVDDSQLITTAEDRAYFMRAFKGAELVTQFMSYPAKMTEIWFTQWRNAIVGMSRQEPELARAGVIGLALYSAPMIMLAGVWGLPFGEQLREGLEALIKLLWKDVENFDDDLRHAMGDGFWAKFVTRGLPYASGVANTSQRMAIDPIPFQEIAEWSPLQLAGPIGGSLIDMLTSLAGYTANGDYFNALATVMPRVIGNALKGANLEFGTGEYRTPRGNVVVSQSQVEAIDQQSALPVSVRQALGFPSPAIADLRTAYQVARETQTQNRAYGESLTNRLARAEADRVRASQANDSEAAAAALAERRRILEEHGRRNEAYERAGERDKMYNPDVATIRRRTLEMLYGRTSPEMLNQMGGPGTRGEIQDIARRYGTPQP